MMRGRGGRHLLTAVALLWPLVLWQLVAGLKLLPRYVVPTPSDTLTTLWRDRGFIGSNLAVTIQEIGLGFSLAVIGALAWSAAFMSMPALRRTVYPLMVAANVAPKELLGPVAILWFGFSPLPKILMAAVIAFFPILVGTMVGLEQFDPRLRLVALSMGASRMKLFFSFRIWNALPSFLASVKLGLTLAIVGAILGEFLGSDSGLGYAIVSAGRRLDGASLFANLLVLISVSLILVAIVDQIRRLLFKGSNPRAESYGS